MKRLTFLAVLAIALSSILWVSCGKEELANSSQESTSNEIIYKLNNIPDIKNEQNVIELLKISQDPDDEKINFHLYSLSLAITELTKEKEFNDLIIGLAKKSHNQCANLLDLKSESPKYFRIINDNLAKLQNTRSFEKSGDEWDIESIAADLTHEPVAPHPDYPETAETEYYYPAIFIPNLEIINPDYQPITSPNIEADPSDNEEIEDNVVAWYYSEEGDLNEILVSEDTSLETTNPLFFLDNASAITSIEQNLDATPFYGMETPEMPDDFVPGIHNNSNENNSSENKLKSMNDYEFICDQVGIESELYRYEASGNSEYCETGEMYWEWNSQISPMHERNTLFKGGNWRLLRSFGKNEIGDNQVFDIWKTHAPNAEPYANSWLDDGNQPNRNVVFKNTYERDWNRSWKNIGAIQVGTLIGQLRGKMKFSSEWYTWMPGTMQIHFTRFHWLLDENSYNTNSWKSELRLRGYEE